MTSPSVSIPAPCPKTRAAQLLAQMTPAEKVAQLIARNWGRRPNGDVPDFLDPDFNGTLDQGIGSICQMGKRCTRAESAARSNRIQAWLLQNTRLKIPALIHEESLHGMIANDVTCLPTPLSLAGTWNPELVREGFAVVGDEMVRAGIRQGLSPVLDLLREARWGRAAETFGEDPVLVAAMGVAAVEGLQGGDARRLLATGKHYIGYGTCEGGHNVGPFAGSRFELFHDHVRPWRAAVEAGLGSVMPSYAAVEGRPCHAHPGVLRKLLREDLGFEGITVADYGGVAEIAAIHGCAEDNREAARVAILAGLDCELPDGECYERYLAEWMGVDPDVAAAVDEAVSRILEAKFRLGLFENPFVDEAAAAAVDPKADNLAARLAEEAVVLLANPGALLPLNPASIRRLAVIGPNAENVILGPYYGQPRSLRTPVEALRNEVGATAEVIAHPGCRITGPARVAEGELNSRDPGKDHSVSRLSTADDDAPLIAEAVALTRSCDAVVLVLGDNFNTTRESFRATPAGDRCDLSLLGAQRALLRAVRATGVPLVVVLNRMGVLAEPELMDGTVALLDAGCLGQEQGPAVARILFGRAEPGGRLAHTVPGSVGELPCHYSHPGAARRGYGFVANRPLFPFGFGLSYTRFALLSASLERDTLRPGETARVRVRLRNEGNRRGSEVVQVYHRDLVASRTRNTRELAAFAKLHLEPGAEEEVVLAIPPDVLGFYNEENHFVQEPGRHRLWITTGADPLGGRVLELNVIQASGLQT